HVVKLPAYAALVLDLRRPRNRHTLARAPEEGWDLLGPLVGRVKRPRPSDRIVGIGLGGTPGVVPRHLLFGRQLDAVERNDFVRRADDRAFGRGAIVAADEDDDRVVELAKVLHGLDDAADLVVGIGEIRTIHVGLADEELLLDR